VPIICDLGVIRPENDCILPPLAAILAAACPSLESGRLLAVLRDSKADLGSLLGLRESHGEQVALCLIVDQFEHFWRLGLSHGAQKRFLTALARLAGVPGVAVLCTLRGDCYHHCVSHPVLMELKDGRHLDLSPPQPWEIAAMLRLGARASALTFETGPDGRGLDDVLMEKAHGNPQALPLLSYVLDQLWEHRDQETNTLRHAVFDSLGGFEGAIAEKACTTCQAFARDFPNEIAAACDLFHLIVDATDSGTGIDFVRRRASPGELAAASPAVRHLSDYLVESRLLVNDANGITLVHDALLSEAVVSRWPALREWMDENARNLLTGGRISQRCRDWSNHGRTDDLLLPAGGLLTEAEALLASNPSFFRVEPRDFIQRSSVVARMAARRATRRRRLAFSFLCMLVLVATGAAIWAGKRERDALAAQRLSEAARADAEKSRLHETKARAAAEGLIHSMTFDLRDKLAPLGKVDLLDDVFCQALEYFHNNPPDSPELLQNEGATWDNRTQVLLDRGDTVGARAANKEALAIIRRLREKNPLNESISSLLGSTYSRLGRIDLMEERPKEARENLLKAVKIFSSLVRHGDSTAFQIKNQFELNGCYMALARVAIINADLPTARRFNEKAASGANYLMAMAPTDYKALLCLGESHRSSSLLASAENNHEAALSASETAVEIAGKLIAMRPEDPSAKDMMGCCLLDLGASARMGGELERARTAFEKASDTFSTLIKTDSRNLNVGVPLGRAQLMLGKFSLKEGDLEAARVRLQSALELFETHANASPKVDLVGIYLIETYEAMACLAEAEKDPDAVVEWRRKLSDYHHKKGRGKVAFAEPSRPSPLPRNGQGTAYARFLPAPDGALLVCAPGGLYLQDRNGERTDLWPESGSVVNAVCNRTGSLLGGVDDDGILMLRHPPPATAMFVGNASERTSMWGLYPGPDGTRWVSVDKTGKTLLREFPSGRTLAVLYEKTIKGIDVAFSPDGRRLAGTDRSEKHRALVWDTRSGTRLGSLVGHKAAVWKVFWSKDGKTIGTCSVDRTARLWDSENGKELVTCSGHAGIVFKIGFHPDGREIITASGDGSACVWSPAGMPLLKLVIPGTSVVHAGFSPDGKLLATQSTDLKLRLWNRATGRNVYTSASNISFGDDDMFSPDSRKLVIPEGGGIRIVDLDTIQGIEDATGAKE
jgi:tetratricopeptide (TPR) repeat protein